MGRDPVASEAVFRTVVDECAALCSRTWGLTCADLLFPPAGQEETAAATLRQTAETNSSGIVRD